MRIGRTGRTVAAAALVAQSIAGAGAAAREAIGVFDSWGAFSDRAPRRCYAIAEPVRRGGGAGWRPFVAVSTWPGRGVRNQLNVRLRTRKLPGAPVMLVIGDRRFALIAGGADAWARDARADARIVAAMRGGANLTIITRTRDESPMVETYSLKGAATAIDAAAVECMRG